MQPAPTDQPVTIGPYRLVGTLGEGGMGVVYLALDGASRAVALKAIKPHVAADVDARRRLAREVSSLRRVRHPNIAEVLDADLEGPAPYVVTAFIPARTLEQQVAQHGPLPVSYIGHLGRVLCSALTAIHGAGVVHRDLKPGNVLLLDDAPILIDFGIAHLVDESRITSTGLVMGTPGYLSPELIDGQAITPATDWWGWGATLAYAATGRPPFGRGPSSVVLDRVRRGQADLDGVDPRLGRVLSAALTVNPVWRGTREMLMSGLESIEPWRPGPRPMAPALSADQVHTVPLTGTSPQPPPPKSPDHARGQAAPNRLPPSPAAAPDRDATPTEVVNAQPSVTRQMPQTDVPGVPQPSGPVLPPGGVSAHARPPQGYPPQQQAGPGQIPHLPPVHPPTGPLDQDDPTAGPGSPDQNRTGEPNSERTATGKRLWGASGITALLGLSLLAMAVLNSVTPGLVVMLGLGWLVAVRVVDRTVMATLQRRAGYGPRASDAGAAIAAMPWRVLTSIPRALFASLFPLLLAVCGAFLVAALVQPGSPDPQAPLPLMAAAVIGWMGAWWGPGGTVLRRGSRVTAATVMSRRPIGAAALIVLTFVVLAAVLMISRGAEPDWEPLSTLLSGVPTPSEFTSWLWQIIFGWLPGWSDLIGG